MSENRRSLIILMFGMFIALTISFGIIWLPHIAIHERGFEISPDSVIMNIFSSVIVCVVCTLISKWYVFPLLNTCEDTSHPCEASTCSKENIIQVNSQFLETEQQEIKSSFRKMEHELSNLSSLNAQARIALRRRKSPSARSLSIITMSTLERVRSSDTRTPSALDISPIQRGSLSQAIGEISDDQTFELERTEISYPESWNFTVEESSTRDNSDLFEKAAINIQLSESDFINSESKLQDPDTILDDHIAESAHSSNRKTNSTDEQNEEMTVAEDENIVQSSADIADAEELVCDSEIISTDAADLATCDENGQTSAPSNNS